MEKLIQKEVKTGSKDKILQPGKEWKITLWGRQIERNERGMSWELAENSRRTFREVIIGQGSWGHREKQICLSFKSIKVCKSNTQECHAANRRAAGNREQFQQRLRAWIRNYHESLHGSRSETTHQFLDIHWPGKCWQAGEYSGERNSYSERKTDLSWRPGKERRKADAKIQMRPPDPGLL